MRRRSQTEQAVLDALARAHEGGATWVAEYGRNDLWSHLEAIWRERYPDRRNRPSHRNVSGALGRLLAEGAIDKRVAERTGTYYRLPPS